MDGIPMTRAILVAAAFAGALAFGTPAQAAGEETPHPPHQSWSFSGIFGTFDRAQLQRGFKVYRESCQNCHSLSRIYFRNLSQPGGPEFSQAQVRALAAEYKVKDGPNDAGDMFERPGRAADTFPPPFPNEQAAAAANGGKAPPDLSIMAKARTYERGFPWFIIDVLPIPGLMYQENGPDYVAALLNGYVEPPQGFEVPAGGHYNLYYPGHMIAMPKPLNDGQIEYPKGDDGRAPVPETVEQYAKDVTAFLMWTAEPHLEARKQLGFKVIVFLLLLAGLLYFTKKKIWDRVGGDPVGLLPEGEQRH
jgi:ubiquinol-cytochrome c reductase cytochrome c1 subunit